MTELNVLAFAIFMRALCVIAGIAGVVYLAKEGKDGWGWLIFLTVLIASTSYRYTPD